MNVLYKICGILFIVLLIIQLIVALISPNTASARSSHGTLTITAKVLPYTCVIGGVTVLTNSRKECQEAQKTNDPSTIVKITEENGVKTIWY